VRKVSGEEVGQEFRAEKLGATKCSVMLEEGELKICDIVFTASEQTQAHLR